MVWCAQLWCRVCVCKTAALWPPAHTNTQPHPNSRLKAGQYLSFGLMNHSPSSSVIKRKEAVDSSDSGQGQTPAWSTPALFSLLVLRLLFFFFFSPSALSHTPGLSAPFIVQLLQSCRGDISPSRSIVGSCRVRGEGCSCVDVCVCVICDCAFFCSRGYFSLLWRILLLRSEEAGYLPASHCAEVITVLCWKEGVQKWGVGERRSDSFALMFLVKPPTLGVQLVTKQKGS